MKLFRPLQGSVLFVYPAINAARYIWMTRPAYQRKISHIFSAILAGVIFPVMFISLFHVNPISSLRFWPVIPLLIAVFYTINSAIEPKLFLFCRSTHQFFSGSALVYTGSGKGGTVRLFPDMIKRIGHREVAVKHEKFDLFTVTFKDTISGRLPNRTVVNFGIPKGNDLTQLRHWLDKENLVLVPESDPNFETSVFKTD